MAGPSDKLKLAESYATKLADSSEAKLLVGAFEPWHVHIMADPNDHVSASHRNISQLYALAQQIRNLHTPLRAWYEEQLTILPSGRAATCLVVQHTFIFDRRTLPDAFRQALKDYLGLDSPAPGEDSCPRGMICNAGPDAIYRIGVRAGAGPTKIILHYSFVRQQEKRSKFSSLAAYLGLQAGSHSYYNLNLNVDGRTPYPWHGKLFHILDKPIEPLRFQQNVKVLVEATTGVTSGFKGIKIASGTSDDSRILGVSHHKDKGKQRKHYVREGCGRYQEALGPAQLQVRWFRLEQALTFRESAAEARSERTYRESYGIWKGQLFRETFDTTDAIST